MALLDWDAHGELISEQQFMSVCLCIMQGKLKTPSSTMLTRPSVSFSLKKRLLNPTFNSLYSGLDYIRNVGKIHYNVTSAEVRQPSICLNSDV